ncbi:DUF4065 domain-containing protein [Parvularcula sp. BGMRC 0090]|uniref:DUF4065 domain-containing protein n=1 Tax=Parvularcula maris TaxID=2965077 RepID=A0A9X2L7K2_9PROT|nr:DUF4065 domain-containing protein [Parvularcula maris]
MQISNLALQKLLYFTHGLFLQRTGEPLVSGYFEAWRYGPVHPGSYAAFKKYGAGIICGRASKINPLTEQETQLPAVRDKNVLAVTGQIIATLGHMTAGQLVDLSHVAGSPWAAVVECGEATANFGLRIPNELIREKFNQHKMQIGHAPRLSEIADDEPFNP